MQRLSRFAAALVAAVAGASVFAQLFNYTPLRGHLLGAISVVLIAIVGGIWGYVTCVAAPSGKVQRLCAVLMILAMAFWVVGIVAYSGGGLDYIEYGLGRAAFSDRNTFYWASLMVGVIGFIGAYFYDRTFGSVVRWVNGD